MDGPVWLSEVAQRASERNSDVEVSRPDEETLGLSRALRTVVIHVNGTQAWFAPSFVAGGTLRSRLQDRVQHLDIQYYAVSDATVYVVVEAVLTHLAG